MKNKNCGKIYDKKKILIGQVKKKKIHFFLMDYSTHPFLVPDLLVKWSLLTAAHVESDITYAIDLAKKQIDEIINTKDDDICYDTVFKRYDDMGLELNVGFERLDHLIATHESKELREAHAKVLPLVMEFQSSIILNGALWNVIKKAAEKCKSEDLSPEKRRFIDLTVKEFIQNGADLPEDKKKRIKEIDVELGNLTKKFADNVKDSTNKGEMYITKEDDLKGLPQSAIDAAKHDATEKGHPDQWRFSLQFPSRYPVMMFLDNEDIRKNMYDLSKTIGRGGDFDNTENVKKITALRDEKAQILGFKTFADLVTNKRMAGSGENALKFVEDLHDKVYKQFLQDVEDVKEYMKKKNVTVPLKPWNFQYWSEKQRKELYDFDEEELKPYFSSKSVFEGLFQIVQTLYGIEVRERPTYCRAEGEPEQEGKVEVWNKDVMFYEVYDIATGKQLGGLYADLYPREDKRDGGWMSNISGGRPSDGRPNIVFLNTNINKPIGDKPALITHYEVSTIFHEFGHCLHGIFYDGEVKSLSGMNVPWDYVELPSQFHENFVWEREALNLFAKHYQTHELIPEDLFKKMIAARNYQSAYSFIRQLYFGRIDLALHQEYDKWKDMGLEEIEDHVAKDYRIDYDEPNVSMYRNFGHLFSSPVGYAAGYYSYKWAEVLDADCFSRFQKEGIFNKETGMSFRKEILEKGNSIPVQDEFRNFMGRDPSQEALLKRSGIKC